MSKLLETEAANILKSLQESISKGTDFFNDQAPIIVIQLVEYNIWEHSWLTWIFLIISILTFIIFIGAIVLEEAGITIFTFFLWLIFGFASLHNWFELHKLESAPNLWLMEYFKTLLQTSI